VIAGRRRNHAAPLLGRQAADEVHAAADFERARRVVILVLDEDVETGFRREQRVPHERRRAHDAPDPSARGIDVLQRRWIHD